MQQRPDNNTVILVGGAKPIRQILRDRCRAEGVNLLTEPDPIAAIALIRDLKPAAVIADIQDSTNTNTIAAIADVTAHNHIPIIAITAQHATRATLAAFDAGAYDAVSAPFDLSELMARLANARERARLTALLESKSQIDALTGLWNRAHFDTRLEQAIAQQLRTHTPFALILADLDHFKAINDTLGHRFGDTVIQRFAGILTSTIRAQDAAFRYGGEEFAVILHAATSRDATNAAERIRASTESLKWPEANTTTPLTVTCSLGIATTHANAAPTPANWIDAADEALYRSKDQGRNQTTLYTPPDTQGPNQTTTTHTTLSDAAPTHGSTRQQGATNPTTP